MRILYQIGTVPVFGALVSADGQDISLSEDRSWQIKKTAFVGTSASFSHLQPGQRILETTKVPISGHLQSTPTQDLLHIISRLKARGGLVDIPIVIVELSESQNTLRWLYTTGTVTDIKDTSNYSETLDGILVKELSIEMEIDPIWKPVLKWYWEYRPIRTLIPALFAQDLAQAGIDNLFNIPTTFGNDFRDHYFQPWGDDYSALSPTAWGYLYEDGVGYGTDYDEFGTFFFNSDERVWSAPPRAMYALRYLIPQGTVQIETANADVTFTASLDLDALHLQLIDSGFDGLLEGDEIFFGDTDPFCSFIRRNDTILEGIVPQWEYVGAYPGEVQTGYNRVTLSGNGTTGQFAVNIRYGAY